MSKEEELQQLRAERAAWREIAHEKHGEVQQLQQEKQALREGLKEAIEAISSLREHVKDLEGQIACFQERVKTLEGQQAKDSHNSSLPPSSDRFVRARKQFAAKERQETWWAKRPSWASSPAGGCTR